MYRWPIQCFCRCHNCLHVWCCVALCEDQGLMFPFSPARLSNKCPYPSCELSWFHLPCNGSQQKVGTVITDQATPTQLGKPLTAHHIIFLKFPLLLLYGWHKLHLFVWKNSLLESEDFRWHRVCKASLFQYSPLVFHLLVGSLMALRRAPPHGATCFGVRRRRRGLVCQYSMTPT